MPRQRLETRQLLRRSPPRAGPRSAGAGRRSPGRAARRRHRAGRRRSCPASPASPRRSASTVLEPGAAAAGRTSRRPRPRCPHVAAGEGLVLVRAEPAPRRSPGAGRRPCSARAPRAASTPPWAARSAVRHVGRLRMAISDGSAPRQSRSRARARVVERENPQYSISDSGRTGRAPRRRPARRRGAVPERLSTRSTSQARAAREAGPELVFAPRTVHAENLAHRSGSGWLRRPAPAKSERTWRRQGRPRRTRGPSRGRSGPCDPALGRGAGAGRPPPTDR